MPTTFTINPVNLAANQQISSASHTLSASITDIVIQMTDGNGNSTPPANSDWLKTAGNILEWGVQMSTDGGATWNYVVWENNIPFGHLTRGGLLPALEWGGSEIEGNAGNLVRLAIEVDTNIKLGCTITVS